MSGDVVVIRLQISTPVLVLLLAAVPSAAQEGAPEPLAVTLEEALGMFAEHNLELRLSRARADRAAGLARQAGAFPNPSLSASYEPLSGAAGSYSETYVTASQRFGLAGARGARVDVGVGRSLAATERLRADSVRIAFDVKQAYVEALSAQERRAVTERIAAVFRDAHRSAAERYDQGDVSLYSLRRIEVERARYETRLADADLAVGSAQRGLALLVAAPEGDERLAAVPLPASGPPSVDEIGAYSTAAARRPELAAARAEVDAQGAQARMARAERVPEVTATGGFKHQSDGLSGAFLGVSVPVPLFDRRGGEVAAAEAELRAAEEQLVLTRRQLENDVRRALESYETLRRRADLLVDAAPDGAGDLLDIALVAYAEGEMELVELLDAAEALFEARMAESDLRASLWIAYFDLERALGGFTPAPAQEE